MLFRKDSWKTQLNSYSKSLLSSKDESPIKYFIIVHIELDICNDECVSKDDKTGVKEFDKSDHRYEDIQMFHVPMKEEGRNHNEVEEFQDNHAAMYSDSQVKISHGQKQTKDSQKDDEAGNSNCQATRSRFNFFSIFVTSM